MDLKLRYCSFAFRIVRDHLDLFVLSVVCELAAFCIDLCVAGGVERVTDQLVRCRIDLRVANGLLTTRRKRGRILHIKTPIAVAVERKRLAPGFHLV